MERNEAVIQYFGQSAKVTCDRKCNKAWGINSRPTKQMSNNEDDYCFLADNELCEAPKDPGTYEGGIGKPNSYRSFPNKWCVRECERCSMSGLGEHEKELSLKSYEKRVYNIKR